METLNFAEQKLSLVQKILALNDINKMHQIQSYVNELLKYAQDIDTAEDEFDAKKISFLEWNKQFDDDRDLDTFIPEYGMKLRDFRFKIYNSERQDGLSKEEFIDKINRWK